MKTITNFRIFTTLSFLLLAPVILMAQVDKKSAELKKLEIALTNSKAKVALNERQITKADSLITAGTEMVTESKIEIKAITAERKKLDKDNAAQQKTLTKLSTSKDKEAATAAKGDLKALGLQYKSDAKALDIRLKDATKKSTTGNSNLTKGKAGKKTAQEALKNSQAALKVAQGKYDVASGTGSEVNPKDKKKR
jgi:hypothetical protein